MVSKNTEVILDYDPDFIVYKDKITGQYSALIDQKYVNLVLCARLTYDINNEPTTGELDVLFGCDVCGEYVTDDYIEYLWFKIQK